MVLLDPISIEHALPGGESLDQESVHEYSAKLRIQAGPFKDLYEGQIHLDQVDPYQGFDLSVNGHGSHGPITGSGRILLEEDNGQTTLRYTGAVDVMNSIAAESPRLIRTTANALIRQYMEGIAYQIQLQTRIYSTDIEPILRNAVVSDTRSGTVTIQEWVARARRDRRTTAIVLVLLLLASLMTLGAVIILWGIFRWAARYFARHVADIIQEDRATAEP
jgi:carbon monoxide dehydrogenase subunit G